MSVREGEKSRPPGEADGDVDNTTCASLKSAPRSHRSSDELEGRDPLPRDFRMRAERGVNEQYRRNSKSSAKPVTLESDIVGADEATTMSWDRRTATETQKKTVRVYLARTRGLQRFPTSVTVTAKF